MTDEKKNIEIKARMLKKESHKRKTEEEYEDYCENDAVCNVLSENEVGINAVTEYQMLKDGTTENEVIREDIPENEVGICVVAGSDTVFNRIGETVALRCFDTKAKDDITSNAKDIAKLDCIKLDKTKRGVKFYEFEECGKIEEETCKSSLNHDSEIVSGFEPNRGYDRFLTKMENNDIMQIGCTKKISDENPHWKDINKRLSSIGNDEIMLEEFIIKKKKCQEFINKNNIVNQKQIKSQSNQEKIDLFSENTTQDIRSEYKNTDKKNNDQKDNFDIKNATQDIRCEYKNTDKKNNDQKDNFDIKNQKDIKNNNKSKVTESESLKMNRETRMHDDAYDLNFNDIAKSIARIQSSLYKKNEVMQKKSYNAYDRYENSLNKRLSIDMAVRKKLCGNESIDQHYFNERKRQCINDKYNSRLNERVTDTRDFLQKENNNKYGAFNPDQSRTRRSSLDKLRFSDVLDRRQRNFENNGRDYLANERIYSIDKSKKPFSMQIGRSDCNKGLQKNRVEVTENSGGTGIVTPNYESDKWNSYVSARKEYKKKAVFEKLCTKESESEKQENSAETTDSTNVNYCKHKKFNDLLDRKYEENYSRTIPEHNTNNKPYDEIGNNSVRTHFTNNLHNKEEPHVYKSTKISPIYRNAHRENRTLLNNLDKKKTADYPIDIKQHIQKKNGVQNAEKQKSVELHDPLSKQTPEDKTKEPVKDLKPNARLNKYEAALKNYGKTQRSETELKEIMKNTNMRMNEFLKENESKIDRYNKLYRQKIETPNEPALEEDGEHKLQVKPQSLFGHAKNYQEPHNTLPRQRELSKFLTMTRSSTVNDIQNPRNLDMYDRYHDHRKRSTSTAYPPNYYAYKNEQTLASANHKMYINDRRKYEYEQKKVYEAALGLLKLSKDLQRDFRYKK